MTVSTVISVPGGHGRDSKSSIIAFDAAEESTARSNFTASSNTRTFRSNGSGVLLDVSLFQGHLTAPSSEILDAFDSGMIVGRFEGVGQLVWCKGSLGEGFAKPKGRIAPSKAARMWEC